MGYVTWQPLLSYRQVSNIRRTWVGNEIVDHSDVVGAAPVGATPTTSSFSTEHLASVYCAKTTASRVKKDLSFGASYIRDFTVIKSVQLAWTYVGAQCSYELLW